VEIVESLNKELAPDALQLKKGKLLGGAKFARVPLKKDIPPVLNVLNGASARSEIISCPNYLDSYFEVIRRLC
jgi:hypothetical protein